MTDWFDVATDEAQERLLAAWPTAPLTNLEVCEMILDTAREDVIAYAPAPPASSFQIVDGLLVSTFVTPSRYVYAQLRQAQSLFDAGSAQGDGQSGAEGFTFIPRPLDKTIKRIIRPANGRPHVL